MLEDDKSGFQIKLTKASNGLKPNTVNNGIYKRNKSSNELYEPSKSKDRLRSSNHHINLSRKNEKMKKLIKEMNAESILTERGISNSHVELEIKRCSINNLYVEKNDALLPRKNSENFNKKLRDTLIDPNSVRKSGSFTTSYITSAETPKKYLKMTKRIFYKRRSHMQKKPLVILHFEGVLGFIAKNNLYFRKGAVKSLQSIRQDFQVVITTTYSTKRNNTIRELLEK